eukprot:CAMPEP_0180543924 /NCGR_PEP_ID=MMETSP1036_2-20121128/69237_1 /TAXON_ID=632150 /ORGANISM="Azadinium spinosum, Strain 3D9" /LENGTH=49 /DNA_ID= /DNA_START= /DNA_END= /DNA_ORIENTATION=
MPQKSPKPVLFLEHGTQDEVFDFSTVAVGMREWLKGAGYSLKFSIDEGG